MSDAMTVAFLALALAVATPGCTATSRMDGTGGTSPGNDAGDVVATVEVSTATHFQVMEGFGGAVAFYVNYLADHPHRSEIYDLVFRDLGLDILRVGNWYQDLTVDDATVAVVAAAAVSLGHPPRLLMSSWSPPASLKSNGDTTNGGTLVSKNGSFAYDAFAAWWVDALLAYGDRGVHPDFISIQNEPDFKATWATCLFGPSEGIDTANGGVSVAGYDRALDAVRARLVDVPATPKIFGPEVSGLGNARLQDYVAMMNADHFDGVAHHLYSGGTPSSPDSFDTALRAAASTAIAKPRFMTEFAPSPQNMFATAWLIDNAVTVEGVNAYIYWDLTWSSPGGLVSIENPYDPATWTTPSGYVIRDPYYALKHFARWVDTGWIRVAATASTTALKVSAFISPDGRETTVVVLNTGSNARQIRLSTADWSFAVSDVFRTTSAVQTSMGAMLQPVERTLDVGPLDASGTFTLPALGIATVTLEQ